MEAVKSIGSFAKFSMISSTLGETRSRADILLLGALLTTAAAGQYQVAMQLILPAELLGSVISVGLAGRISAHWSKDDEQAVVEDLSNSIAYAGVLAIPIFFGALAMPSDILYLVFGSEYSDSGAILIGLALFAVLRSQTYQFYPVVGGINRPEIGTKATAIGLMVNLLLGILLLRIMGAVGVVVATVLAEIVIYLILAYSIKGHIPNARLVSQPLLKQFIAAIIMFGTVWCLHTFLSFNTTLYTATLIVIGAITYGLTLSFISPEVRKTGYSVACSILPPR
jgi:O-antigen/teichoic acid export membrane protein